MGNAPLLLLPAGPKFPEIVNAIVEIPRGTSNKFEYDKEMGVFRLDRTLYSPMHYPGDYGFIPSTLEVDGDPQDVIVLTSIPTFTGALIQARVIGGLRMVDQGVEDIKLLAVPVREPRTEEVKTVEDLPKHTRREFEHFFDIYKELEGRPTATRGWVGLKEAHEMERAAHARFYAQTKSGTKVRRRG